MCSQFAEDHSQAGYQIKVSLFSKALVTSKLENLKTATTQFDSYLNDLNKATSCSKCKGDWILLITD